MTLDEAIKHAEEVAKEQKELYRLCPASESDIFHCDGTNDCKTLKNGKNKGCLKCAEEHRQLAEWLKELKQLRVQTRWIPVNERLPEIHNCSEYYLVTLSNGEVTMVMFTETNGKSWWERTRYRIIAWMPLPTSYSEVEE